MPAIAMRRRRLGERGLKKIIAAPRCRTSLTGARRADPFPRALQPHIIMRVRITFLRQSPCALMAKLFLVTGSSRGIGRAIARGFAARGAKVALHYKQQSGGQLRRRWPASTAPGIFCCRPTSPTPQAVAGHGSASRRAPEAAIDILVNNAGIYEELTLTEASYEEWGAHFRRALQVNLLGAANASYCAARYMSKNGGGTYRQTFRRAGAFRGEPTAPAYGASKAGMNSPGAVAGEIAGAAQYICRHGRPRFRRDGHGGRATCQTRWRCDSATVRRWAASPSRRKSPMSPCSSLPTAPSLRRATIVRRQRRFLSARLTAGVKPPTCASKTLETERLRIRHFVAGDLECCARFRREVFALEEKRETRSQLAELDNRQLPPTFRVGSAALRRLRCCREEQRRVCRLGRYRAGPSCPWGALKGNPSDSLLSPEIGLFWGIMPDGRRRGFASEAAGALLDYLFDDLGARQVVATNRAR